jgi:hypothetical protein
LYSDFNNSSRELDQIKEDEMDRECSTNGEKMNAYRMLVGKPERKRPLEDQDVGAWTILK